MSIKASHCTTEIDAIFTPVGCDPFGATASPKSHYFPSLLNESSDQLKHAILTPEKIEKIPVKDNESYIPLNYSYCEENSDSSKESIPEALSIPPTCPESEICVLPEESKSVDDNNLILNLKPAGNSGSDDTSLVDCAENIFLSEEEIEQSEEIQPKMSSTQRSSSSNISQLVNRFRYGKPLPPSERKRQNTTFNKSESTHSNVSSRPPTGGKVRYDWLNSDVMSSASKLPSDGVSSSVNDFPSHNTSIDELQHRVEQILKESTSALSSLPEGGLSEWSSVSQSVQNQDVSTLAKTSSDTAAATDSTNAKTSSLVPSLVSQPFSSPVDKDSTAPSAIAIEKNETLFTRFGTTSTETSSFNSSVANRESKLVHPLTTHFPSFKETCRDFSTKPVLNPLPSPSPLSLQDDILQQWRLRRRMEEARSAAKDPVAKHHFKQGYNPQPDFMDNQLRFTPAEKPLDFPSVTKKSVGVSVVPVATAQTQTSPTSSISDFDVITSSKTVSDHMEKNDGISMHKVTVVPREASESRPTPPESVTSQTPSTVWSEVKAPESADKFNNKPKKTKKSVAVSSPTTTTVKKVIGARLFNVSTDTIPSSESTHKPSSNDTFSSSTSEQTTCEKTFYLESKEDSGVARSNPTEDDEVESHQLSDAVENPDEILRNLLQRIESDVDDFKDDPVLISLRDQRRRYMAELLSIDAKLKQLQARKPEE